MPDDVSERDLVKRTGLGTRESGFAEKTTFVGRLPQGTTSALALRIDDPSSGFLSEPRTPNPEPRSPFNPKSKIQNPKWTAPAGEGEQR